MTKDYLRKNVSFDMLNEVEKEMYEYLQKLPHGEFNRLTKLFWLNKMDREVHKSFANGTISEEDYGNWLEGELLRRKR